MTNDTQSTKSPETEPPAEALDAGKLAGALFGIGATWARYGLAIGRASLAATAVTLETTSEMLGRLSKTLEATAEESFGGKTADQVRDRDASKPTT